MLIDDPHVCGQGIDKVTIVRHKDDRTVKVMQNILQDLLRVDI